jgi:hypothetical protein
MSPGHHTKKEKRQAAHIKAGYVAKGVSPKTAASRAWATVTKGSSPKKRAKKKK